MEANRKKKQKTFTLEIELASEVDTADAVGEVDTNNVVRGTDTKKQKWTKNETKQQRSLDSDRGSDATARQTNKRQNKARSSSSNDDNSLITVPDGPSEKNGYRIATYDWLDDEEKRRLLIEEDKQRIAKATGTPINQLRSYHD